MAYLKLKNYSDTPPNEYYWIDPNTKVEMRAGDIESLFEQARVHRINNKLEVPADYNAFIEDTICRRAPERFVRPCKDLVTSFIGTDEVVRKTDALMRAAKKNGGKLLCSAGTALDRAMICSTCKENKRIMCQTCNGVLDWMRQSFRLPNLPFDEDLHVCRITHVLNKAQVHLAPNVITTLMPEKLASIHPENCWKPALYNPVPEIPDEQSITP